MENEILKMELKEFNNKDYNNQRAVLCFMIDKSRNNESCESCQSAYQKRFCNLCEKINVKPNQALEIYNKITSQRINLKFKLKI